MNESGALILSCLSDARVNMAKVGHLCSAREFVSASMRNREERNSTRTYSDTTGKVQKSSSRVGGDV